MAQYGHLTLDLTESPALEALKWTFRDQAPKSVLFPVTFATAWDAPPIVLLSVVGLFSISGSGEMPMTAFQMEAVGISTTGFQIVLVVSNGNQANLINVSWLAVSQAS